MWNKLKKYLNDLRFSISEVFYSFLFPAPEETTVFHLAKIDKYKWCDFHFIEIKGFGLEYNSSLINRFFESQIVEKILREYRKKELRYFKCIFEFRTEEDLIWINESLDLIFTPNDSKALIKQAKNKLGKKIDYYNDSEFRIKTVVVNILFLDDNFIAKRD